MSASARNELLVELQWDEPRNPSNAAEATWGRLSLSIDGHRLWGSNAGGIHWTWIELLEWLADAWAWIRHEEAGPAKLPFMWDASRPSWAMDKLARYLEGLPASRRGAVHEEALEFVERHDLARALQGAIVPSVLVLREGHGAWVAGHHLPLDAVLDALERLGAAIVARIEGIDDERASAARDAWATRDVAESSALIEIATGMSMEQLEQVTAPERRTLLHQECATPLVSEYLVAARLARTPIVPDRVLDELLAIIGRMRKGSSDALDRISAAAIEASSQVAASSTPFEQGHALAGWLRRELDVAPSARVEPELLLSQWGVVVESVSLSTPEIDAVALWGPRRGPAVLVNDEGRHNQSPGGRNATLAHEIQHLLVDRGEGLPLAEVIGGHAPVRLEQRARAFAAELLVPREIAGAAFATASRPPHAILQTLVERYGASQEVVAWQARNAGAELPPDVWSFLRSKVSRPDLF